MSLKVYPSMHADEHRAKRGAHPYVEAVVSALTPRH
jgi:hypothetical protein